jgi:hypothetical protein
MRKHSSMKPVMPWQWSGSGWPKSRTSTEPPPAMRLLVTTPEWLTHDGL